MSDELMDKVYWLTRHLALILYVAFIIVSLAAQAAEKRLE